MAGLGGLAYISDFMNFKSQILKWNDIETFSKFIFKNIFSEKFHKTRFRSQEVFKSLEIYGIMAGLGGLAYISDFMNFKSQSFEVKRHWNFFQIYF